MLDLPYGPTHARIQMCHLAHTTRHPAIASPRRGRRPTRPRVRVFLTRSTHAGQAVVQFVRAPQTNAQYAMKLFAGRAAYNAERSLFATDDLRDFMPPVVEFVDNEDGAFRDPFGNPMPPCFVMERGEALQERTARCAHDFFTIIQVRPRGQRHDPRTRALRPVLWAPCVQDWCVCFWLVAGGHRVCRALMRRCMR